MEPLFLHDILKYCEGRPPLRSSDIQITGISTDSRTVLPGELFIPLKGEFFDGHNYIEEAFKRGAVIALSERPSEDERVVCVSDTGRALLDIAAGYRRRFRVKATAITGSAGKTTTKDMAAAVLTERFPTLKTEGNLNNLIGVPLSVFRLEKWHRAAVFEMGMNRFGEISAVTKVALPRVAVITNIGTAHIEFFGSRSEILKAKLEILEGMAPDGVLLLNGDDPLLYDLRGKLPVKTVYFGLENPDCHFKAGKVTPGEKFSTFELTWEEGTFLSRVPAAGLHNIRNAAAALSVGLLHGLSPAAASAGLANFETGAMRQRITEAGGVTIIDDCYNANPESVAAALSLLTELKGRGKRIAVLGGMLELGAFSDTAHYNMGLSAAVNADAALFYGSGCEKALLGAKGGGLSETHCYNDHEALAKRLLEIAEAGDVVLFKGSRGMRMEEALRLFTEGRA